MHSQTAQRNARTVKIIHSLLALRVTHTEFSHGDLFFLPCWLLFASKFVVLLLTHCSSAEFSSVHRAYFLVLFSTLPAAEFGPAFPCFPLNSEPRWVSQNFRQFRCKSLGQNLSQPIHNTHEQICGYSIFFEKAGMKKTTRTEPKSRLSSNRPFWRLVCCCFFSGSSTTTHPFFYECC